MNYDTVSAAEFGSSLKGLGLNLLVRNVLSTAAFLRDVFGMKVFQPSADFAIMMYGDQIFQLHSDATFHSHPLPSLLPEAGPRGGGGSSCDCTKPILTRRWNWRISINTMQQYYKFRLINPTVFGNA